MGQRYQGRIVRWLGAFAGRHVNLVDLLDKEITRSDREVAATLEGATQRTTEWQLVSTYRDQTDDYDTHHRWLELYELLPYDIGSSTTYEGGRKFVNIVSQDAILQEDGTWQTVHILERQEYELVDIISTRETDIYRPDVGIWLSDQSVTKYFVTDVWSVKDESYPGRLRPTHRAAASNADHGHAELFCRPQPGWIKGLFVREHPSRLSAEVREAVLSAAERHGLSIFYPTKKGWKKV